MRAGPVPWLLDRWLMYLTSPSNLLCVCATNWYNTPTTLKSVVPFWTPKVDPMALKQFKRSGSCVSVCSMCVCVLGHVSIFHTIPLVFVYRPLQVYNTKMSVRTSSCPFFYPASRYVLHTVVHVCGHIIYVACRHRCSLDEWNPRVWLLDNELVTSVKLFC